MGARLGEDTGWTARKRDNGKHGPRLGLGKELNERRNILFGSSFFNR